MNAFVSLFARISQNTHTNKTEIHQVFGGCTFGRGSVSSGGVAIPYVLPVFWVTLFAHSRPGNGDASRASTH